MPTSLTPRWTTDALLPVVASAALLALWEVLSRTVLPPEIPPVSSVLGWLSGNASSGALWAAIGQTLAQWAVGLGIAVVAGSVIGAATGTSPVANNLLTGLFEFFRPIPAVVYLPLLLLLMGATAKVSIILAAVSAFWPVLYQVHYGVKSIDPVTQDTSRVFGLTPGQRVCSVVAPSILPFLATGVRIASTIALLSAIVMELLGGVPGLGIVLAQDSYNGLYSAMYGILFIAGVLGVLLNSVFTRLDGVMLHWHPGYRTVAS